MIASNILQYILARAQASGCGLDGWDFFLALGIFHLATMLRMASLLSGG
jgi:hypothetical protein